MKGEMTMLKPMTVTVKYEIYVQKNVIADDNEDDGVNGYDTKNQEVMDDVHKRMKPILKIIKDKLPKDYKFDWDCDSEIEEI